MTPPVEAAVDRAFREEWGQVVATLIRWTGDWDLAEECAQDAFALALRTWRRDGVPRRPGAWLTTPRATGPWTCCAVRPPARQTTGGGGRARDG
ncbi:sigma factor [Microbispora sp. GKU 823]|uniref:sigma factor n=1 Tax=Microbispora sp. GKU 823 TaxID=1652100 RepID=UPI0021184D9B|nr:sigma factor [Microbispora sp. GKU 823]